ncbi:hypothetical protein BBM68_05330 [Vibrio parahaemolyticus]|uniref:Uncharacterized protein n=1 Tax=Vibrio ponticus TaxID=265668 RepID=A0A3N3E0J7_9VIBR|nr:MULTISPECIES: hypothetical protein [Vibrio]HAT8546220.1 hypothetical protein [Vibrio vulnificus]OEA64480.1 hypothetical protein BBM67_24140 [Vibrio parahaemolyticus]OEA77931.1 hypothetical protein BBM68_05330 [Vibrio parahaemolyticus]ROV60186.1 hypothetical protein EGH82_10300 [Vibrio ponticus]HCG9116568.1 hypothetical protein [Vibrio parahaemolyticus]
MQYAAVMLCPDGGIIRHQDTQEVANVFVGDFDSMEEAVNQACLDLSCTHLHKGVISKGTGKGGFMLVTTQELGEV